MDELETSILGDCAKKCQQAFLAPMPEMDLKPPYLVIALRNANSDTLEKKPILPSPEEGTVYPLIAQGFMAGSFYIRIID